MARRKLVLVAFEQGEGPWICAQGNEAAVRVSTLREGEIVRLEIQDQVGGLLLKAGYTPIKVEKGKMYRIIKSVPAGKQPSKTAVEVLLNGPTDS